MKNMAYTLLNKLLGDPNVREVKRARTVVARVNTHEAAMKKLTDEQLRELTTTLKKRHTKGESLDDLLPEAFAAVREAAGRVIGMRHYDVQLVGGVILHSGKIAE